jgi:hypothetical protein
MTALRISWRASLSLLLALSIGPLLPPQAPPPAEAFQVLPPRSDGPQVTPYLQYQLDQAWRLDEAREHEWEALRTQKDLLTLQSKLRQSLLQMIGGLPGQKTDLHPRTTGTIQRDGFSIEKLIFESLPGVYVTALVYVPDDRSTRHPAVLVPAGHATNGKIHYQTLCARLAKRGYLAISWDPIGQGERSQFWDVKAHSSRYNLVCGEHAVLGNLAYLAGANLARWEIWDGIRAVDYLLTRPDVDPERIGITGSSGGGTQTTLIAALDLRIKVVIPSCYITTLPMRMANRIFADPDSDPEQDLFGMLSNHVGHTGLLLLMYPRPLMIASAVLDFVPIEGARKSFRETQRIYERFQHADRIAMTEGYHAHQYSDANQEAALDFLDRFSGMPVRHGIANPSPVPDQDLLCTNSGQVLVDQKDARPLTAVIRDFYFERRSVSSGNLRQAYSTYQAPGLEKWQLNEFHGLSPDGTISWQFIGAAIVGSATIDKYLLHHSRFLKMPLLYIHQPSNPPDHAVLWFKETGKVSAPDWSEIETLLRSGHNVISFDFRALGETRMNYAAVSVDTPSQEPSDAERAYGDPLSGVLANYVYNSLLTGRPYFFQMIDDAKIARRFAREKLGVTVDSVTARGNAAMLARAISEVSENVRLLPQSNANQLTWSKVVEQMQEIWLIQYLVPAGAYIRQTN